MWDWWENFILQFDAATRDIFSNATSMERTSSLFGCRFEWETAKKMQFSSVIAVALPKHHNKYSDSMHWASSEWTSRRPLYVTSTSYIVEFPIQWRYSFSACVCFTNIPRSQSWYTYNIAKAGTTEKGDVIEIAVCIRKLEPNSSFSIFGQSMWRNKQNKKQKKQSQLYRRIHIAQWVQMFIWRIQRDANQNTENKIYLRRRKWQKEKKKSLHKLYTSNV